MADPDRKIIVGIDFGTTYSGIAWGETERPDRRMANISWPISQSNREGESSEKVPSRLRYTQDGTEWGFSIPITAPEAEVVEWFKLDLDPTAARFKEDATQNPAAIRARQGKEVDALVSDYLSALVDHLLYMLRQKLGETVIKGTPFEFVVTVPAIWSENAKERTRKACRIAIETAGMKTCPIHLISEPEAAAIYSLHGLDPHGLEVGDTIVVVDAGGGTVDIITYRVKRLKPILEVEEAAPGSGGLCGSTFLNKKFAELLRSKLGRQKGFDDEVMAEAMEAFEKKVKRRFTMADLPNGTFSIPVGGLANNKALGISRGRWTLPARDVEGIFEPVVLEVIKLVKDQIAQSNTQVKAILMVGGFGSSQYLKESIRGAMHNKCVEVMQPAQAWQAVVQGAVMKGLANCAPERFTLVSVRGRRARKHYGIQLGVPYEDHVHGIQRSQIFWDGHAGHYRIKTMQWFLKRGDEVLENDPITARFRKCSLVSEGPLTHFSASISVDMTSKDAPLFPDENVRRLATLRADLGAIPGHEILREKGYDGQLYYVIHFEIEQVYLSASTQYTLIYKNQRYDTVTCEYV